jgi:hypothetical protein
MEGKTKAEKVEQKKKLFAIKDDLKAARKLAGVETLKVNKLLLTSCSIASSLVRGECIWTRLYKKCTSRTLG